jgi:hypothetical protein
MLPTQPGEAVWLIGVVILLLMIAVAAAAAAVVGAQVLDGVVEDKFIRNWLDLLSFLLSGGAGGPAGGISGCTAATEQGELI